MTILDWIWSNAFPRRIALIGNGTIFDISAALIGREVKCVTRRAFLMRI